MQLANPNALWALGLIPLLIIIHNLRSRPRQMMVTNLFLWEEIKSEMHRGLQIRRLIWRNLSLLLQVLIIILSSLALAKPVSLLSPPHKGDTLLVLDSSASMKTQTGSGTRFDHAKAEALTLVDELPQGNKMLIIEAGGEPKILSDFSDDKERLRELINRSKPTDTPGQLIKTISLALSFVDPLKDDSVIVITDGCGGQAGNISLFHQKVRPVIISGGENNVGITRFEFRQLFVSENAYEILLQVKNFNPHPILCPIRLSLDGTLIFEKTIGLYSLEKRLFIVPYSGLIAGIAEARLDIDDDFPVDDAAYAVLRESQDIWVLLVTKGNYFLERLLEAYPNVQVNMVEDVYASSWETQVRGHDIVIIDQTPFPATEKGSFLIIDSFSPSLPLMKTGQIENPDIVDWNRNDPIMLDLDLSDLRIAEASSVKTEETLKPLLESSQTGLIYAFQKKDLRMIFMGFDINQSDLPLKTAFPIMMSNILQWLYPNKLRFSSAQVRAGQQFPIYVGNRSKSVLIRTPSGDREKIAVTSNPVLFADTYQTGLYRILEGDKARYFAVNLVDEHESDIRVPDINKIFEVQTTTTDEKGRTDKGELVEKPLWFVFVIAALALLLLEWHVWVRGKNI